MASTRKNQSATLISSIIQHPWHCFKIYKYPKMCRLTVMLVHFTYVPWGSSSANVTFFMKFLARFLFPSDALFSLSEQFEVRMALQLDQFHEQVLGFEQWSWIEVNCYNPDQSSLGMLTEVYLPAVFVPSHLPGGGGGGGGGTHNIGWECAVWP